MAMGKTLVERREQKKACEIQKSFSAALDEAFESELDYVIAALRQNRQLTYAISGLIKNDGLTALLDGRLDSGSQPESPTKKSPVRKIRAACKRFKHFAQQPCLVDDVLQHLMPSRFTQTVLEPMEFKVKLNHMCFLLGVTDYDFLPTSWYNDLDNVGNFLKACGQRYETVMKKHVQDLDLPRLSQGYFYGSGPDGPLKCIFDEYIMDAREEAALALGLGGTVTVEQPQRLDTKVIVENAAGQKYVIEDIKDQFESAGVKFPDA